MNAIRMVHAVDRDGLRCETKRIALRSNCAGKKSIFQNVWQNNKLVLGARDEENYYNCIIYLQPVPRIYNIQNQ